MSLDELLLQGGGGEEGVQFLAREGAKHVVRGREDRQGDGGGGVLSGQRGILDKIYLYIIFFILKIVFPLHFSYGVRLP